MKIKQAHIKNFKSCRDLAFKTSDSLENVNMVFGYNNSGKSNLVSFFQILFKKKYGGKVYEIEESDGSMRKENRFEEGVMNFWEGQLINSPYLFSDNNTTKPIQFSVVIEEKTEKLSNNKNLAALYKSPNVFVIDGAIIYQEYDVSNIQLNSVVLNETSIFERNSDDSTIYFPKNKDLTGNQSAFEDLLSVFNDAVDLIDSDRNFKKEQENAENKDLVAKNLKNWLYQLKMNPDTYDYFSKLISKFDEFNPTAGANKPVFAANLRNYPLRNIKIDFFKKDGNLILTLFNKKMYPIENYGKGIQQLFFILLKVFVSKSSVLIIEELELNLSPEYQNELLKFLKLLIDRGEVTQLLFTSHSNYMVNHFDVGGFFALAIDENGNSNIEKLSPGAAIAYFDNQFITPGVVS